MVIGSLGKRTDMEIVYRNSAECPWDPCLWASEGSRNGHRDEPNVGAVQKGLRSTPQAGTSALAHLEARGLACRTFSTASDWIRATLLEGM